MDVWQYIHVENIPISELYFAKPREMIVCGKQSAQSRWLGHSEGDLRKLNVHSWLLPRGIKPVR